jgi:NAD(P)-dependent dehydrogenase (short-subunit alcohol dehydrogenase family)
LANMLVIGGTSGLGLEIAKLAVGYNRVIITGRTDPKIERLEFKPLYINSAFNFRGVIKKIVAECSPIDTVVYAAGFYQKNYIEDLKELAIDNMTLVGLTAPCFLMSEILRRQNFLKRLVVITSTSEWMPRGNEPVYTAVKAGLAMLAASLSQTPGGQLNSQIGQTLVEHQLE